MFNRHSKCATDMSSMLEKVTGTPMEDLQITCKL